MNGEDKHRGDVNALEEHELNRMNGSRGKGRGLFVSVVKLMEVAIQPWPVKDPMAPVRNVVLQRNKVRALSATFITKSKYIGSNHLLLTLISL